MSGAVTIVPVTTRSLLRQFVELPYGLYAGDSHWVPPLRRDEYRRLSRTVNPFFQHADMDLWVAQSNGRITGRIAAIEDHLHNTTHGERTAWFGFFEAEDTDTARAMLAVVEAWATARGTTLVRGPASPSLNASAGVLVDGFDDDPYVLMPYNPARYATFMEDAGYAKVKDLLAWSLDATVPMAERITKLADRVRRRHGIVVRTVDMRQFERDLGQLKRIYRTAWESNWGFVPPTDAEISQLAADLRPILDPSIALFAEIQGRPVACAIAIPDMNQVLRRMNGHLLPFGLVHFLRRASIIDRARVLLVGVMAEVRNLGLYPLLVAEIFQRGTARGYRAAELSWTLEDNVAINAGIEASGGRRSKTYRIYEKPVGVRPGSDRGQTGV